MHRCARCRWVWSLCTLFKKNPPGTRNLLWGLILKGFYCYSDSTKTNLSPPHIYLAAPRRSYIERFIQRCSHRHVSGSAAGRGLKRKMGGAVVLYAATTHSSFRIFTLPHTVIQLALILSTHTFSTRTHSHWIRLHQTPMTKDYGYKILFVQVKACVHQLSGSQTKNGSQVC